MKLEYTRVGDRMLWKVTGPTEEIIAEYFYYWALQTIGSPEPEEEHTDN